MKILLVEDDRSTSELLVTVLTANRYAVDVATDGQMGLELAMLWNYDLIVLDVQIPKLDGMSVCRQLRSQGTMTPILILTAQGSGDDIIRGLDAGADDYMTKPCIPDQLLARIRALLRRGSKGIALTDLTWGNLCLNPASVQVTYNQQLVTLRPKEYSLLELLLRHPQRVFSRNAIIDHLWAFESSPTEHAVTNLIKDLRRQLKAAGMVEELIETVYGLGYRLNVPPDQKGTAPPDRKSAGTLSDKSPSPQQSTALTQVIERFRDSLGIRIEHLIAAVQRLQEGSLDAMQQTTTREEAHRLAGSLGTFGYARGSHLMREFEQLLMGDAPLGAILFDRLMYLLMELQQEVALPPAPLSAASLPTITIPGVLLIGQQTNFTNWLQQEVSRWGLQLDSVPNWVEATEYLSQNHPVAFLLTLTMAAVSAEILALIPQLKQQYPMTPVLVLTEQDSLNDRVQVARFGGDRYLSQPITPAVVFQEITQLLPQLQTADARVLIVDDDPSTLALLTHVLQPWGIQVTCLSDPSKFWQVLTKTKPHLLLLDVAMPTFNGIELCQVVRQDPTYGDLPILVVTAYTDGDSIQQVFHAGADDLIRKPIVGPELVTRVVSRIERSRLRQQLDHLRQQQTWEWRQSERQDPFSQIANRETFDEYLHHVWQRLVRSQQPLALLLCSVDDFDIYQHHYGQPAGQDRLKQITGEIQGCLKRSDQIARYGDATFAILLPNTSLTGALCVAERIQQTIASLKLSHVSPAIDACMTVSLGITGTVPTTSKSVNDLIETSNQALNAAKAKGRSTYCLYPL